MSLRFIPNQPVYFAGQDDNDDDLPQRGEFNYKIPVKYNGSDKTYMQFKVAPLGGSANLITDASFLTTTYWSVTGSGTILTGSATIGDGSTGSVYRDLTGTIIVGKNYQLKITVTTMFGTAKIYDGTQNIGEINSTGTFTLSYTATNDSLFIKIFDSTSFIELDNVSIYALPENFAVAVLDTAYLPVQVINFIDDPEYFTLKKDTLTVIIDWDTLGITQGCYYIGVTDPETNNCNQFGLYNHDFTIPIATVPSPDTAGWNGSSATEVLFYNSYASITVLGIGENYIINTRKKLCANKNYTIIISALSTVDDCDLFIRVNGISTASQFISFGTPLANYTFTITPTTDGYLEVVNQNAISSNPALLVYDVNLSLTSELDFSFEYTTVYQYSLSDLDSIKTKLIGLFNNEDGLGFVFTGSNFFPQIRCLAKFINRKYKSDRDDLENDIGFKAIMYGESRKSRVFRLENQPNFVHDFLQLTVIADQFYVDETAWFVETDKYEPNYADELDNFAPVELELSNPTQLVRNINSGEENQPPSDFEVVVPDVGDTAISSSSLSEAITGDIIYGR